MRGLIGGQVRSVSVELIRAEGGQVEELKT